MLANAQGEGDHGVGQENILLGNIVGFRQGDFHAVHIGRPARFVGNGGVEQALFLDGDIATEIGICHFGEIPNLVGQAFHTLLEQFFVLQNHIQGKGAVGDFFVLKGEGDDIAFHHIAHANHRPHLGRRRENIGSVDIDVNILTVVHIELCNHQTRFLYGEADVETVDGVALGTGEAIMPTGSALFQGAILVCGELGEIQVVVKVVLNARCQGEHFQLVENGIFLHLTGHEISQCGIGHKAHADIVIILQEQAIAGLGDLSVVGAEMQTITVNEVFQTGEDIGKGGVFVVCGAVTSRPCGVAQGTGKAVKVHIGGGIECGQAVVAVEGTVIEGLGVRYLRAVVQLGVVFLQIVHQSRHMLLVCGVAAVGAGAHLVYAQGEGQNHLAQENEAQKYGSQTVLLGTVPLVGATEIEVEGTAHEHHRRSDHDLIARIVTEHGVEPKQSGNGQDNGQLPELEVPHLGKGTVGHGNQHEGN